MGIHSYIHVLIYIKIKMKKSQIQMGETIAILFVFSLLVAFGFIFYLRVMHGTESSRATENLQLRAIQVAQKASFMPEYACSEGNVVKDSCVDLIKVESVPALVANNKRYYYDALGFGKIKISKIFPPPNEEWIIYDESMPDYKNKLKTIIPTALLNVTSGNYYFGVMEVEVYSK